MVCVHPTIDSRVPPWSVGLELPWRHEAHENRGGLNVACAIDKGLDNVKSWVGKACDDEPFDNTLLLQLLRQVSEVFRELINVGGSFVSTTKACAAFENVPGHLARIIERWPSVRGVARIPPQSRCPSTNRHLDKTSSRADTYPPDGHSDAGCDHAKSWASRPNHFLAAGRLESSQSLRVFSTGHLWTMAQSVVNSRDCRMLNPPGLRKRISRQASVSCKNAAQHAALE